ncbi:MAG: HipA N-terminal domain-containing protein [Planctomycetes bacterium]|nr:HipA N-terminal domain-containing protein [Planctomycetota bacterium]
MTSERECYVYVVLPGETAFVTAGRFRLQETREGAAVGEFIYGRSYRERADAVELDPVQLRLQPGKFETAKMDGFFGAIRDAMPDSWGRKVIERYTKGPLADIDYLMRAPDDRAGALGFGNNAEPPFPENKFNRTLDLERLQSAADALISDDPEHAGSAAGHDARVRSNTLLAECRRTSGAPIHSRVSDHYALERMLSTSPSATT